MVNENPTVDQVSVDDSDSGPGIEENIKSRHTWLRLLFMVVFSILLWLTGMVGAVVVIIGFLWVLFKGEVNEDLRGVGQSLARYVFEIVRYLTFNTDEKPFPFGGRWPSADD
jgi:hypothetical protein